MLKNIKDIRMNKPRSATHVAHCDETNSLAPRWESGFAYGRSETSSLAPRGRGLGRGGQERCRLMRGAVNNQNRGGQDERCRLSRGAVKPNSDQDLYPRPFVGEGVRRTGEGSHSDKTNRHPELVSASPSEQISQTCIETCSLAPRGRGLGRGGQDERCRLTRGADKPSRVQDLSPRPLVGEGVRRTGEGSHSDKTNRHPELVSASPSEQISQTCIENSSLAPRGRGLGRGGQAAFTLAEVLITLGIIGIVAALTMPALITNIQDRIQQKRIENINQKLSKVTDKMAVQSG